VLLTGLLAPATGLQAAAPSKPRTRSGAEILASSTAADWRTPDPAHLLYMELDAGRVIIELAPAFAPEHVANIRTLAREHFWDNTSVYRVQDNFVAQFGDADGDEPAKAKSLGSAKRHLPAEFHRDARGLPFDALPDADGWAAQVGFVDGFAVGRDAATGKAWLAHCYGAVGAGRNNPDDSSLGAELYAVIGQSPRQIDDNITVVGHVLQGMPLLSGIRRGPPPAGFYVSPGERTPIRSIRLASEVPEAQRTTPRVLRTDTAVFAELVEAQRNRVDAFYKRPAGHIDLCNVTVPARTAP
jgi:peptidylprolyl isomerase